MSRVWQGSWPTTRGEWDALVAQATVKYRPLLTKLPPWEVVALCDVAADELKAINEQAHAEDIRNGHRPPGTQIGAR